MKNFSPGGPDFQSFFGEYKKNLLEYGGILWFALSLKCAVGLLDYCAQVFLRYYPVSAQPANIALMCISKTPKGC